MTFLTQKIGSKCKIEWYYTQHNAFMKWLCIKLRPVFQVIEDTKRKKIAWNE